MRCGARRATVSVKEMCLLRREFDGPSHSESLWRALDLKLLRREVTQTTLYLQIDDLYGNGTIWKVSQSKHWSASLRDAVLVVPLGHKRSLVLRSSAFLNGPENRIVVQQPALAGDRDKRC